MNKIMAIYVKGKEHKWSFMFIGNDKFLEEWREDGLNIDLVVNTVPMWVADLKLTKIWCFLQDIGLFRPL